MNLPFHLCRFERTNNLSLAVRSLAIALAVLTTPGSHLQAEPGVLLSSTYIGDSENRATGQQLLITTSATSIPFDGRQIDLDDFSGISGYANEIAYIAVIEGVASVSNAKAKPGQMLLLRPHLL